MGKVLEIGITKINVLTKIDSDIFEKSIQLKVWDKIAHTNYRSFEEARAFAIKLKLKSNKEWKKFTQSNKFPKDIPMNPGGTYRNKGWKSWGDFLGTLTVATTKRKYKSFKEAKKFVKKLGLKKQSDWGKYVKSGKILMLTL